MSEDDIKSILNSNKKENLRKLFSKIIYNSKDKLSDLKLFDKNDLKVFFNDFEPSYNKKYILKHVKVLKALLLDEKSYIKGLEWKK